MKKTLFRWLFMLMCICATSLSLSSCSKDGDDVADYYITFELVDAGSLGIIEANYVIEDLNLDVKNTNISLNACTRDEAIQLFDTFVFFLKKDMNKAHDCTMSFNCNLKTGNIIVKQTLVELTKSGNYIKSSF